MRSVGRGPLDLSFGGDTRTGNTSLVSLLNNKKPDSSKVRGEAMGEAPDLLVLKKSEVLF